VVGCSKFINKIAVLSKTSPHHPRPDAGFIFPAASLPRPITLDEGA
jgi:hypothetical protein